MLALLSRYYVAGESQIKFSRHSGGSHLGFSRPYAVTIGQRLQPPLLVKCFADKASVMFVPLNIEKYEEKVNLPYTSQVLEKLMK